MSVWVVGYKWKRPNNAPACVLLVITNILTYKTWCFHWEYMCYMLKKKKEKIETKLENRICRQIQDLHASFWCGRVE